MYITLPLYFEFNNPKQYKVLHEPFARALLHLGDQASRVLIQWWVTLKADYFERLVNIFKNVVMYIIRHQTIGINEVINLIMIIVLLILMYFLDSQT